MNLKSYLVDGQNWTDEINGLSNSRQIYTSDNLEDRRMIAAMKSSRRTPAKLVGCFLAKVMRSFMSRPVGCIPWCIHQSAWANHMIWCVDGQV